MRETLLIVDDFLDNAMDLREAALHLAYDPQQQQTGGRSSRERINIEGLEHQISWLVNERLAPIPAMEAHARCRLTLAGDEQDRTIRIDESDWSGILFLTRPDDSEAGVDFYRHIRTDTDGIPLDHMRRDILEQDGLDQGKWELAMSVPTRFNRLVLFRSWLWHAEGPGFGDRPDNGRLVYRMFFQPARS